MPLTTVARFSTRWLQILRETGTVDGRLMPRLTATQIRAMHSRMVLARVLDEKCLALQREGRMGTYASVRGQEAAQVGSALALQAGDWLFPAFRETAANVARGIPLEQVMAYWAGDERGDSPPKEVNNFTVAVPVGTQIPHAVGVAWGMAIRKRKTAALVYFGDGATSKGDFHEALNWAGVFRLPIVFVCQNNQWAISLPVSRQTAAATLAQKAVAYGFEGIRVDGNDVFAMYRATRDALGKAYAGRGPTLIEALTYRIGHHTTSDDSWRYRTRAEVERWKKRDPIARLERYLKKKKLLTDAELKEVAAEARRRVEEAVRTMEAMPAPQPQDLFDHVFQKLTPQLQEQRRELLDSLKEGKP